MRRFHVSSLILAFVFFGLSVFAGPLPPNHFLYPVDQEILIPAGLTLTSTTNGARKTIERCDNGTVSSYQKPLCEFADMLRASTIPAQNFPWQDLTAQVVLFGERHPDQEIKGFLADHVADLRRQGVTALAFEMFNSKNQIVLDRYLRDEITIADVAVTLQGEWGYESQGYLKLIEAAKRSGLRLLALDDRDSFPTSADFLGSLQGRDGHMAKVLAAEITANPSTRVAMLCGRMHAFSVFSTQDLTRSLPARLRHEYGLTTQSVNTFGTRDDCGINSIQKAIVGETTSTVSVTPQYPYSEFLLFLR